MPDNKPSPLEPDVAAGDATQQNAEPAHTQESAAAHAVAHPKDDQSNSASAATKPSAAKSTAPEHPLKTLLTSIPALLTAIGGVLAAVAALVTSLNGTPWFQSRASTPLPTTMATESATAPRSTAPSATPLVILIVATPTADVAEPPSVMPTLVATATVAPTPSATRLIALDEDFAAPQGWSAEHYQDYSIRYDLGQASFDLLERELAVWENVPLDRPMSNLIMQVDARRAAASADGYYGLVVREDHPGFFYLFAVSSDGWYAVQRSEGEDWIDLVPWTESERVLQGEAVNRLRVECHGHQMRFYVNDELVQQIEDLTHTTGKLGLLAGSEDTAPVEIVFDDLMVRELADE